MDITIIDKDNEKEIREQIIGDTEHGGFNFDALLVEYLTEVFFMVQEGTLEIV